MNIPTKCDRCESDRIGLTSNSVIYGEEKGDWPYCYYCDDCGAYVGCHLGTYTPMGYMAGYLIRRKREKLHKLFDVIWQSKYLSRNAAYRWLSNELKITIEECHIGYLSPKNLSLALSILTMHYNNNYEFFIKRNLKQSIKRKNQLERENGHIRLRKTGSKSIGNRNKKTLIEAD